MDSDFLRVYHENPAIRTLKFYGISAEKKIS